MHKFLKFAAAASAVFALTAPSLTAPAFAQRPEITVSTTTAMEEWRGDVTRDLDRNLKFAEKARGYQPLDGIVQIRFHLDDSGRPADLQFYRSSGSRASDKAAHWAVRRLNNLDEVPTAIDRGTVFQANIIFARSAEEHTRLARKLEAYERTRLASASPGSKVIALGS
ncbi:MAG: TonB family protein [Alteripontixanthobacter sp.]